MKLKRHAYIPRFLEVPNKWEVGTGLPVPGRTKIFWGGRKPSKYCPLVEAAKHAKG